MTPATVHEPPLSSKVAVTPEGTVKVRLALSVMPGAPACSALLPAKTSPLPTAPRAVSALMFSVPAESVVPPL